MVFETIFESRALAVASNYTGYLMFIAGFVSATTNYFATTEVCP